MRNTVGIDVLLLLLLTTINGLVALSDAHSLDFNCHFHIWQLRNTFVDRYARRPLQINLMRTAPVSLHTSPIHT